MPSPVAGSDGTRLVAAALGAMLRAAAGPRERRSHEVEFVDRDRRGLRVGGQIDGQRPGPGTEIGDALAVAQVQSLELQPQDVLILRGVGHQVEAHGSIGTEQV